MSTQPDTPQGFHGAFRQSMSWLHTWVGLVLSVVLYFIFVTGTAGYFQTDITRWMEPERGVQTAADRAAPLPHSSETMAEAALAKGFAEMPDAPMMYVGWPVKGSIYQNFYAYGEGRAAGEEEAPSVDLQLDMATLGAKGEGGTGVRETGGGNALYVMHYDLHYIPFHQFTVLGYKLPALPTLIVGVATMFMLVAIVTGIVVHKKIFADFFTFRAGRGQRSWLDAHNLSSVLALPFMVVITYSGLMMYAFDYMPTPRDVAFGTSEEAREAFDHEAYPEYYAARLDPAGVEAPLAPAAPMIAQAREAWGGLEPQWLDLYNAGDANARAMVWSTSAKGEFGPDLYRTMLFDATTGEALPSPDAGPNPAGTVVDVMIGIHEGNYAGPVLRWLYLATGSLGAAMVATGLVLWTTKRRQKLKRGETADFGLLFVERTNVGIVVGLLIGVAAYFWANRLLPVGMEERAAWEMHVLFIAWGLCLVHAAVRPAKRAWVEQFALAALAWGLIPVLNALTTDIHLGRTLLVPLGQGDPGLAAFDLTMLAFGGFFALAARKAWANATAPVAAPRARRAAPAAAIVEPAE